MHFPTHSSQEPSEVDIEWYDSCFLHEYTIAPLSELAEEPINIKPAPDEAQHSDLVDRTISLIAMPAIAAFGLLGKIR